MASRNVIMENQFVQLNSLCTVPFRSWSQGQFCLEFVWCDCSMRLVQIVVFAHSFCSCTNNCFLLFGGIVQCEAASCRVQTKCGVCKTFLLYLDKAVGLLWLNFTMAVLRIWIGACFFVRARRLSVSEYIFLCWWGMMNQSLWEKTCSSLEPMRMRVETYSCHTNARLSTGTNARRFIWQRWCTFLMASCNVIIESPLFQLFMCARCHFVRGHKGSFAWHSF